MIEKAQYMNEIEFNSAYLTTEDIIKFIVVVSHIFLKTIVD